MSHLSASRAQVVASVATGYGLDVHRDGDSVSRNLLNNLIVATIGLFITLVRGFLAQFH